MSAEWPLVKPFLNANLLDVRAESATPDEERSLRPGGDFSYGIAVAALAGDF
jgi:hypothetical protein